MNNSNKATCTVWATVLAFSISLTSPTAIRAANINWGSAANITGDSNVDTTGVLAGAINFGDDGTQLGSDPLTSPVVNGVTFQALAITDGQMTAASLTSAGGVTFSLAPNPNTDGLLTLPNGSSGFGSTNAPYTSLSTGYQALLGSGVFINGPDTMVLTLSNLAIGQVYQFQWFVDYSGPGSEDHIAAADTNGNNISLTDNTTGLDGGLGQYAIGTFIADSTSQVITFQAPAGDFQSAQVNAVELRAVPDSMNTLLGLGLAISGVIGFYGFGRRQRRALQKS